MKYVLIFHANLNYAYLPERKYEYVIRNSYELIFDTMRRECPDAKYVFEASGYTIEQMALRTPDVLEKLKAAVASGQCEFMGSPYAHPMLANYPEEDGRWCIRFANRVYQRYLGFQPCSFWNPEFGWRSYVKNEIVEEGYRYLIGEFEAYSRSCGLDGRPLRPEIYEVERIDNSRFYNFVFKYDLPGTERAIHFPFKNVQGLEPDRLRIFLRTDRLAVFGVWYFMSHPGYTLENYVRLIQKYSQQNPGEPEGALIVYADDAEYIGTNAWYRLKYCNDPEDIFQKMPDAREKLVALVSAIRQMGPLITFQEACQLPALEDPINFDEDSAWHGGKASNWAMTPMARHLRPWQDLVREKLRTMENGLDSQMRERIWYHLTCSYNSDAVWPPTTKASPHIIHPFNYKYAFEHLLTAEMLLGGVDHRRLPTDPVQTLEEILTMQQDLVLEKAEQLIRSGDTEQRRKAETAVQLIRRSRDFSNVSRERRLLYPSDYEVRANALMEARQLVGGVEVAGDK